MSAEVISTPVGGADDGPTAHRCRLHTLAPSLTQADPEAINERAGLPAPSLRMHLA